MKIKTECCDICLSSGKTALSGHKCYFCRKSICDNHSTFITLNLQNDFEEFIFNSRIRICKDHENPSCEKRLERVQFPKEFLQAMIHSNLLVIKEFLTKQTYIWESKSKSQGGYNGTLQQS